LETSQLQLQIQTQEIAELETEVAKFQEQIDRILKTAWTAADILRERQELERQELAYQKLINEQKEIASACQNAESKLNINQENLQLAQTEFQKAEQEKVHRQSQLQEVSQRLQEITVGKSYESLRQSILQAKSELSDRLQSIEKSYQKARETFVKREEAATKAQDNHNIAIAECTQQETNWHDELQSINFTESAFLTAQTTRSQMESWQKEIETYQRQEQDLTTRRQMFAEAIAYQHTDEIAIANLRADLQQIEQDLQLASENRASIKAWLEQARQRRQESQDLEERKISLQSQEQIYHTLSQDCLSLISGNPSILSLVSAPFYSCALVSHHEGACFPPSRSDFLS
jgi:exonuclease SbcC